MRLQLLYALFYFKSKRSDFKAREFRQEEKRIQISTWLEPDLTPCVLSTALWAQIALSIIMGDSLEASPSLPNRYVDLILSINHRTVVLKLGCILFSWCFSPLETASAALDYTPSPPLRTNYAPFALSSLPLCHRFPKAT